MSYYKPEEEVEYWQKRYIEWAENPSPGQMAGNAAWFEERFSHILPNKRTGEKVLDFGCGSGSYSPCLNSRFDLYYGIDTSSKAIELAKIYFKSTQNAFLLIEEDVLLAFDSDTFDCVLSITVLQHQHPPRRNFYVNEIKRVLKSGGIYVGLEFIGGTQAFDMPAVPVADWLEWWKPLNLTFDIPPEHPEWSANNVWVGRKP